MAQVKEHTERALLLSLLRLRRRNHPATWSVGIGVLGVANLLFCAYFERFINTHTDESGLLVLLAVESCFLLTVIGAVFAGELEGILRKTTTLPVTQHMHYQFALLALVRHPAILVLWGTAVFAVAAVGPATVTAMLFRAELALLLGTLLLTCFCTLLYARARGGSTSAPVIAVAALTLLAIVFASATVPAEHLLSAFLPLQWTVDGIIAADAGDVYRSGLFTLYLVIPSATCFLWGRRYG